MGRDVEFEPISPKPPHSEGPFVDEADLQRIHEGFDVLTRTMAGDTDELPEPEHVERAGLQGIWNNVGRAGLCTSVLLSLNAHKAVARVLRIDTRGLL